MHELGNEAACMSLGMRLGCMHEPGNEAACMSLGWCQCMRLYVHESGNETTCISLGTRLHA